MLFSSMEVMAFCHVHAHEHEPVSRDWPSRPALKWLAGRLYTLPPQL